MLQLWQKSAAPLRALDVDVALLKRRNERYSRDVVTHQGLRDKIHTAWLSMVAASGAFFWVCDGAGGV